MSDTLFQTFTQSTDEFYDSSEFAVKEKEASAFLQSLPKYLDGRNASLENMVRAFIMR
jgi:prostatic aicd phosphatase